MPAFPYVNLALTPDEFATYVNRYDFGRIKPDFVVFHHTVDPAASWATGGLPKSKWWDRDEGGLSGEQIRAKRLRQLGALKNYYQNTLGWSAGPHLFVDDRYIYLMTPMSDVGIHAKWGNSFVQNGELHYSIGIEMIGHFENALWPVAMQAVISRAVFALFRRLGTFALNYMYADCEHPGMIGTGDGQRCAHPELLRWGGLSSHRDYNKPSCPGRAITEAFYTSVANGYLINSAGQVTQRLPLVGTLRYKVRSGLRATVRSAPNREADIVEELNPGTPVSALGLVNGQAFDSEARWAQLDVGRYIHLSALQQEP